MKVFKNVMIALLIIGLSAFIISFGLVGLRSLDTKIDYEEIINKYAEEYNSDPLMIASIIKVESGFDTEAVSEMNAKGLMQILPDTGEWIAAKLEEDYHDELLHDPDYNIKLGAYYYEYLYEYFGDESLALAAYNGGMGNVEQWLEDPEISSDGHTLENIPFAETRDYVDKVQHVHETYKYFYKDGLPNDTGDLNLVWENYKKFISDIVKDF